MDTNVAKQAQSQKQKFYLKKMAAMQFPGSHDNVSTGRPLHMVQDRNDTVVWHSLDSLNEVDDCDMVTYARPDDYVTEYKSLEAMVASMLRISDADPETAEWKKAVKDFNAEREENEPLLVPYTDTYMAIPVGSGKEEDELTVEDEKAYLNVYNDAYDIDIDVDEVYGLEHFVQYRDIGPFFILSDAKAYLKYQGHNLKQPRTFTYGEAYGDQGDYAVLYDFLMETGKDLLDKETEYLLYGEQLRPDLIPLIVCRSSEHDIRLRFSSPTYGSLFGMEPDDSRPYQERTCKLVFDLHVQQQFVKIDSYKNGGYWHTSTALATCKVTTRDNTPIFTSMMNAFGFNEVADAVKETCPILTSGMKVDMKPELRAFVEKLVNYMRYSKLKCPKNKCNVG